MARQALAEELERMVAFDLACGSRARGANVLGSAEVIEGAEQPVEGGLQRWLALDDERWLAFDRDEPWLGDLLHLVSFPAYRAMQWR
jgi:hypothetical protein